MTLKFYEIKGHEKRKTEIKTTAELKRNINIQYVQPGNDFPITSQTKA